MVATCSNGFKLNQTTGQCVCALGTYLSGTACLPCSDGNCVDCSLSICNTCAEKYYPVGANCVACPSNCQVCRSGTSCDRCSNGFSLNGNGVCTYYGGGLAVTTDQNGNVVRCEVGCQVCAPSSTTVGSTICMTAMDGYTIIGGVLTNCGKFCKTCLTSSPTVCSSCYAGSVLIGGVCTACSDVNALTCSPLNVTYSLTCQSGYTSVNSANANMGQCTACATYCKKCAVAGPGACDASGCEAGTVMLSGTTTCTPCFGGCMYCSDVDPNVCVSCGTGRYMDGSSVCQVCGAGCGSCTTSATNCQSCVSGYSLVGSACVLMPDNCVSVNAAGQCTQCLGGYTVSNGACSASLACNTGSTCTVCPNGYYLLNSTCTQCSSTQNCLNCNANNCIECNVGYFLDSLNSCQTCNPLVNNCIKCYSSSSCITPAQGYYLILDANRAATGKVGLCVSPCASCSGFAESCTSCVSGYTLIGSLCRQNAYLIVQMTLGQGSNATQSIFLTSDSLNTQLFKGIKSIDAIGNLLLGAAPIGMKGSETNWRKVFFFQSLSAGSLVTTVHGNAGSYTNSNSATTDMNNGLANAPSASASMISYSVSASGLPSGDSDDDGANLGLILGLAIPFGLICSFRVI